MNAILDFRARLEKEQQELETNREKNGDKS